MDEQKPVALDWSAIRDGDTLAPDMMTAESRDWLIQQLVHWPVRVDPDCTTNDSFLRCSAARWIEHLTRPQPAPDAGGLVERLNFIAREYELANRGAELTGEYHRAHVRKIAADELLRKELPGLIQAAAALTDLQAKLEEAREVEEAAWGVVQGYVDGEIKRATWDGGQLIAKLEDALGARHEP